MKINGVGVNNVVSLYNDNNKVATTKKTEAKNDTIEISSVGKNLSSYSSNGSFGVSNEKLEEIRKAVSSGSYNKDSKLVAQKIIDNIKGREV